MLNIIFNTTRQWNCGDEFILFGVMNIFKKAGIKFNPIIYNRNPDIRPMYGAPAYRNFKLPLTYITDSKLPYFDAYIRLGFHDNSVKFDTDCSFVDLAVFAGTPENTGWRNINFFEHIVKYKIPVIALGIGYFDDNVAEYEKEVFKKSIVCTVRDKKLLKCRLLQDIKAKYLPCPAFLCAPLGKENNIKSVKNVALCLGVTFTDSVIANYIKDSTFKFCVEFFQKLMENHSNKFNFSIICHYIDELPVVTKIFGKYNVPILYSYDAKDYLDIYANFDFCISSRVHSCGISSSLGIPNINIAHDNRAATTEGFLSTSITDENTIDEALKIFEKTIKKASEINKKLIKHKKDTLIQYVDLIKNNILFSKVDYNIAKIEPPFNPLSIKTLSDFLQGSNGSISHKLCKISYRLLSHFLFGKQRKYFRRKYKQLKMLDKKIFCD